MDCPTEATKLASQDGMDPIDRIRSLPDEFIAHIFSLLTLRDALATSFVSKRWKYLWISHATRLDFYNYWYISVVQFVELVDEVLQHYNRSGDRDRTLYRFSIECEVYAEQRSRIGRWFKFALSKRVKELELRLCCSDHRINPLREKPELSSDETWPQNSDHISPGYRSYGSSWTIGLSYLKHLVLGSVSIEGKFMDYLLANCLDLEQLVLMGCYVSKSKLMVSGQSLKLKVLHIESCHPDFTHIEIYNVNLVSLIYRGKRVPRIVGNIPQLCIGCPIRDADLDGLSNSISHVQILKFEFDYEIGMHLPNLPQLRNVMQLEITLTEICDGSLLPFTQFAEVCPNLRRFVLEILFWETRKDKMEEIQRSIVRCPLEHLELVEFRGPYRRSSHYELVRYFIDNAVALKKLVVNIVVDSRRWYAEQILEKVSE